MKGKKLHHLKKKISKKKKPGFDKSGFLFYICGMKNFDLNNFMFVFFVIALIFLTIMGINICLNLDEQPTSPKNELKIQKNVDEPVVNDTTIVEQKVNNLWPIKVVSVEKSYEKDTPKWRVVAENGVMFYTNNKPKIGDIAFYINDNDDITDKYGRVEITRQ